MWLITPIGIFSAVRKPDRNDLTIRARARGDLDRLRDQYLPELGPIQKGGGTDYPYRAHVPYQAFAEACAEMVCDIDYSNFKNQVRKTMGASRQGTYHAVWSALRAIEREAER